MMYRQLILLPQDPDWVPVSVSDLEQQLRQTGLLGDKFAESVVEGRANQQHFIGENFLQHINFMGCAPAVEFQPASGNVHQLDSFIFVHLVDSYEQAHWLADMTMAKPACPHCKKRFAKAEQYHEPLKQTLTCPHCGMTSNANLFDWKEFGGDACTLISIVNAYPKETIPSSNLLMQLKELTGTGWRYCYYFGELIK